MRPLKPLAAAVLILLALPAAAAPRVVASIPPVHGLVAAVMEGAGAPHLLIPGDASPHHHALRPSDAAALAEADLVFAVGAGLEARLAEAAAELADGAELVELAVVPGVDPLPAAGDAHDAEHAHDHDHHGDHPAIDPHLWLDPAVAVRWVDAIAAALAEADPENAALYRDNAAAAAAEVEAVTEEVAATLDPLRGRDYAVFHDAFRYFERRFGLEPAASLATVAGTAPGARGVARLAARLGEMEDPCLFAEPQHDAALIESLARDSGARVGTLDPIGRDIPPGPEFYPQLIRTLAADLARCLDNGA